jgi:cyclopropane-fatty-acyl-phospholipid synthase
MTLAQDRPLAALARDSRAFRRLPAVADAPLPFRIVARAMAKDWRHGTLTLVTPQGRELVLRGPEAGPDARLTIWDYRFLRRVLTGGTAGFAEGFMGGEWETPNLARLGEAMALNFDHIRTVTHATRFISLFDRLRHALNANSRRGSKRNIHAHYDLGNAFYEQWLDPSMTYSSALYAQPGQTLEAAQENKYRTLAQGMGLQAGHHVLEIGCGWGGFAEYAAREVGARVTGVTISREQYDFARKRLFDAGLAERADVRLVDYRDVEGQFDRVASIEMFEAVGERYWPAYFDKIAQVLKPGGRAGLQIITIDEAHFDDYRRSPDFIQKYIFPGGMLPSEPRLEAETRRAGLGWAGIVRFGQDYADTLAEWAERFEAAWQTIRPLGFDERFNRLWRFYLAYCEAGFRTRRTDVVQLTLAKA